MFAPIRSIPTAIVLLGLGCRHPQVDSEPDPTVVGERTRSDDGDPRVDPSRCVGADLDLRALIDAGVCTIGLADARALPGPELLEIELPNKLKVEPGGRLDFELELRNVSDEELTLDLAFGRFLPLAPVRTEQLEKGSELDQSCTLQAISTEQLEKGSELDQSCTLQAISTEPPPERISLPPKGVLAVPCQWFANTRLVDPSSYVGSECPDFPALAAGRYRSVFVISGGASSTREVSVEIVVR